MTDRSMLASTLLLLGSLATASGAQAADQATPAAGTPEPAAAPAPAPPAAATPEAAESEPAAPKATETRDSEASQAAPTADTSPATIGNPGQPPTKVLVTDARDPNSIDDHRMGSHQSHFLLGIGWRQAFVGNAGLDPFSDDDSVPQVSLSLGRTLVASGNFSLVGLLLWDWGSLESTARAAKTTLVVNRLTLGAEARYHFFRRLYAFGRVAPGVLHTGATLADSVTQADLESSSWVFATDLSAGAAFEVIGDNRGASTRPRGWVGFDGGYGWAAEAALHFKPDPSDNTPVRTQPQSFGELAVRGPFLRLTATLTY